VTETVLRAAAEKLPTPERRLLGFDPWLVILIGAMVAFGLVMVYSASWDVSWRLFEDPSEILRRQVTNLVIGLLALAVAAGIPLRWLRRLALPILLFSLLALIVLLLVHAGGGPRRAFLAGSIQPSELAKLALIIYLAVWMESKGERLSEWGYGFLPLMVIIGLLGALILMQPDLSAALTVGAVALGMFFLAGARASQYVLVTTGSAGMAYVLVWLTRTGRERWQDYVDGLVDIEQASYHVQQSLQAFYGGGLFGRGLGASRQKFGFLPAPHTDSIYSIIGEELGLIGALGVLLLFYLLLWRGFRAALAAPDRLGFLLGCGVSFWVGVEAMVNMSVLLGMLPFAGNALPFFSYGGSSLVTTLAAMGLLLNISRRRPRESARQGFDAVIGVGWRHRRRSVSRLSRRARPRPTG
jgi:cell division protein FtsW